MKTFKVVVLRGTQNFTLVRKALSEIELKNDLHKEGFSVGSVEEIQDENLSDLSKFYFEIRQNGEIKTGTIQSNDIFKSFLKVKYELKYDLIYIYPSLNTPLEEKQKIIHELEEQYQIYLDANKKLLNQEKEKSEEKLKTVQIKEESIESFQMQKEIEYVGKIIERVIQKMKAFIELPDEAIISFQKKEKLRQVLDEIIKVKTSTNIAKLKQIGELGLVKIGEIELEVLETKKIQEVRQLLQETNKLLKSVGSRQSFIEKEKDIGYQAEKLLKGTVSFFSKEKKKKKEIDKTSSSYLKTKRLYNQYVKKKRQIQKEILQKIGYFFLPIEKYQKEIQYLILKQKVIDQNLVILHSKLSKSTFSYSKMIKGYNYFIERIISLLQYLRFPVGIFLFLYVIFFIIYQNFVFYGLIEGNVNMDGIFFFLLTILVYMILYFSKGLGSLIFNFVFFGFIFIVGVVNF